MTPKQKAREKYPLIYNHTSLGIAKQAEKQAAYIAGYTACQSDTEAEVKRYREALEKIKQHQVDLPEDIQKIINDNFWDLL